jgi:hypothetical protein
MKHQAYCFQHQQGESWRGYGTGIILGCSVLEGIYLMIRQWMRHQVLRNMGLLQELHCWALMLGGMH